MNKKGFTLIELLAVIVILAIIALITAPIILGVIENARKDSAKDKAWGTIKAVELAYTQDQVKDSTYKIGTPVTFNNKKASVGSVQVKASGELPESGTVTIREDGSIIAQGLKFKEYTCSTIKSETNKEPDSNNMVCVKREYKVVYRWTTDSLKIGDSIEGKSTTTDYNSLGKNHFLKHEVVDNKITASEACFIKDSQIYCLKPNQYETSKAKLLEIFGESICSTSTGILCQTPDVNANASSSGHVVAYDGNTSCNVDTYLRSYCVQM